MRVSIVGTGYVGLVSGVCLAHVGHDVVCVDLDEAKVERINAGQSPIHEDGLPELLAGVVGTRFRATTDLADAVRDTEVTILAVGTPFGEDRIDLGQIEEAARQVGKVVAELDRYHVVAVKSTVVPGTTEDVVGPALEAASGRRVGAEIGLAMNPEFLREGVAVQDFLEPDRIVLGGVDERTLDTMAALYAVFDDTPVLRVDPRTAEMIKYTANALLATLISFSNEVGNLSGELGVDVVDVLEGVHLDRRFSPVVDGTRVRPVMLTYLAAGCGFGGSCFPKDVKALVAHGRSTDASMDLLEAVLAVNARQPLQLLERLEHHVAPAGSRVAVLGAAFKPGTDDVRESPTLTIVPELVARGAEVVVHDPIATGPAQAVLGTDGVAYTTELATALDGADAVLLVTSWPEYRDVPELLAARDVPVVDGRRVLPPDAVGRYDGIGYPRL
ncbi:UDP-glucose dehydrogenase family protein [Egicoccus halophilus]|uniref:UDP-glucose 6-dehydrogenase n=1 Tax=Egicoccus halophilus TaxID=1670830 RepID=A0A8J3ACT1_9ACTN|nr:UDP-glucose/GDP-mannose dehydrogenase family protein [Egicoccus halophilus]GGI05374.1 UDP-glucose/GDP-mannose dehydrogenase family protein [Egicoccus halophilus]